MILGARAQAQASIGGDKAVDAFKEYMSHLQRVEREDETEKMKTRLDQLKDVGEIRFQSLVPPKRPRNLPVVSMDELRKAGKLASQMRPATSKRPSRARPKRKRR